MTKMLRQVSLLVVEQFVQPISVLAATTLLLPLLGAQMFGLFTIVLTMTAMSSLLSFGTSSIISREVANRLENIGPAAIENALRESISVILPISAFAAAGMILFFSFKDQFGTAQKSTSILFILVVATGLGCAVVQELDLLYSGAIKGFSRFDWSAKAEIGGRIVWLLAVVFGAHFWSLEGALAAGFATLFVKAVVKGIICINFIGSSSAFLPSFDFNAIRYLLHRSVWLWVQRLGGILLFSVDRLLVGSIFGAVAMGAYVACSQVAAVALTVPAAGGQALVPWFARHMAQKTAPTYGWRLTLWLMSFASAIPGLLIAATSYLLLWMWLGSHFAEMHWPVLSALAFSSSLMGAAVPFHFGLLAIGETRAIAFVNLAGGVIAILLCWAAARYGLVYFSLGKIALPLLLCTLPFFLFPFIYETVEIGGAVSIKQKKVL